MRRVSSASSMVGKAFWPVCSHDLTSARVVKSPEAIGSTPSGSTALRWLGQPQIRWKPPQRRDEAVGRELDSRLGWYDEVAVLIAEILTAAIRAHQSVVVAHPDRAD